MAEHRGGPLGSDRHAQLIMWACACAQHVIGLCGNVIDGRLTHALRTADSWGKGEASVGEARKASVAAHAAARESSNPVSIAIARSVGHAVATAHMADHSLGAAWYALKAVKAAGASAEAERTWQNGQLPSEIRDLVLSAREARLREE